MCRRMNECANEWVEEGGNLSTMYETDQYKQSVQDMITLRNGEGVEVRRRDATRDEYAAQLRAQGGPDSKPS